MSNMIIEGRKLGLEFNISIWGWRPIHALICLSNHIGSSFLGIDMLKDMTHKKQAGPSSQHVCNELADRMETLIKVPDMLKDLDINIVNGYLEIPLKIGHMVVNKEGKVIPESEEFSDQKISAYRVSIKRVEEFIKFLRLCGGFKVC